MRPLKPGLQTDAMPDKATVLHRGWRRGTKGAICVAALVLATAGFVVGSAALSSRQTPAAVPRTAAMAGPASQHRAAPGPLAAHTAADIDASGLCSSRAEGPPAVWRPPAIAAHDRETQRSLDLAREHESRGDAREAEQIYRSLLEKNALNAEAHAGLGRALSSLGELLEADAHLQRAVLLNPQDTQTRLNLAAVQVWLLRYASAREQIQAVLDLDPEGARADGARALLQLVNALDAPA